MTRPDRLIEDELARSVGSRHIYVAIGMPAQQYRHVLNVHLTLALGDAHSTCHIRRRTHGERRAADIRCDGYGSGPISLRAAGVYVASKCVLPGRNHQVE